MACVRFIPAGAGNTTALSDRIRATSVYPRWRGEHLSDTTLTSADFGLSPLARGTLSSLPLMVDTPRFIPAGAGNTHHNSPPVEPGPVYPRWRGEHNERVVLEKIQAGLSPLARGTRYEGADADAAERFIPAGAGNTHYSARVCRLCSVYPRWRGEHMSDSPTWSICSGLSPLARGTPAFQPAGNSVARFIPAGAGNTLNGYNCL